MAGVLFGWNTTSGWIGSINVGQRDAADASFVGNRCAEVKPLKGSEVADPGGKLTPPANVQAESSAKPCESHGTAHRRMKSAVASTGRRRRQVGRHRLPPAANHRRPRQPPREDRIPGHHGPVADQPRRQALNVQDNDDGASDRRGPSRWRRPVGDFRGNRLPGRNPPTTALPGRRVETARKGRLQDAGSPQMLRRRTTSIATE